LNITFNELKKKSSLFTEPNYFFFKKVSLLLTGLLKLVLHKVAEKKRRKHVVQYGLGSTVVKSTRTEHEYYGEKMSRIDRTRLEGKCIITIINSGCYAGLGKIFGIEVVLHRTYQIEIICHIFMN